MKMKALAMMVVMLPGMALALETTSVRFDARSSGLIAAGIESKGTPSGASVTSWTTTSVADGWQTLSSESQSKQVLVLNEPAVEGGRLAANVTWNAGVHVVRHDVIVPNGKTLTLAYGCKVKFAEGTRIWVEQGGTIKANGANVTELADDSVGGDTNHDGASSATGSRWWWQAPSAAAVADYLRPTASCVSWAQVGLGELTLNGAGASADAGALAPRVYSTNDTTVCVGTLPTLTRSGYVFGGWYTQPNGAGTQVTSTTKVKGLGTAIYASWTAVAVSVADPVITPPDGSTFSSASCRVTIACATDGASIYYTTNGTTPRTSSKYLYSGPFDIFGTSEIVAVAVKDGLDDSDYVSAVITKVAPPEPLTLAKALDIKGQKVTTGGDADWTAEEDALAVDKAAARSGTIGCEEETWMSVTVKGPGTFTFKWKGDCEADPRGRYTYDRGEFTVDGTTQTRIDGETDWKSVSVSVTGAGEHVLTWTYVKDDYDEEDYEGGDCIWVDAVTWSGSWPEAGASFPDLGTSPTAAQVAEAVAGAADPGVRTHITDGTSYNAFRTWALAVKDSSGKVAGLDAVANSSWAWLSYALASEKLIAALNDGDVRVEAFEPKMANGKFDFTVSVDGVQVGNAAAQENLRKVFAVEGGSSLGALSSDNVELTFGTPDNGKVKFTAGPKDTSQTTFFMSVKMVQ